MTSLITERRETGVPTELRQLADLLARGQHKQAVQQLRRRLPCAVAHLDEREVLVDSSYAPLWERLRDGSIRRANPDDRVTVTESFFIGQQPKHQDFLGMKQLRKVLLRWGLIKPAQGERAQPLPRLPLEQKPLLDTVDDDDERDQSNDVAGPFAAVSKNLCNYPLARDRRTREWRWYRGKDSGRWYGKLPDDDRISYRLNANADESLQRCPTAFDMNVLFLLLAETQKRKNQEVVFDSRAAMLRTLGYSSDQRHRDRLTQSLIYWAELSICFGRWWFPEPKRKNGVKWLKPPVVNFKFRQNWSVWVRLEAEWHEPPRYYQKLPLPLPQQAAAQNFVLLLLVSRTKGRADEDGYVTLPGRKRRSFCRKLGLNHKRRNEVLEIAAGAAAHWFEQHGGKMGHVLKDGRLGFYMQRPNKRRAQVRARPLSSQPADSA